MKEGDKPIQNRYEFVFIYDVTKGNPNGDPDSGNMPRIDIETQKGIVTDVCIKRKIRNYCEIKYGGLPPYRIYATEKAILNDKHQEAYDNFDIKPTTKKLPKKEMEARKITEWMCSNFFDIRTFGAVMTTEINCGQVRGPVQLSFSESF